MSILTWMNARFRSVWSTLYRMRGHIWEQANNHFYEYSHLYDSARGQQPLRAFVYARARTGAGGSRYAEMNADVYGPAAREPTDPIYGTQNCTPLRAKTLKKCRFQAKITLKKCRFQVKKTLKKCNACLFTWCYPQALCRHRI